MCYMSLGDRVGVRELRQNLSIYLKRVLRGETLEVTERGEPVAILAPLPKDSSPLNGLVALGRATRPNGDLFDVIPPKGRVSRRLSQVLKEQKAERL
jgi:prevent-host-death family protein